VIARFKVLQPIPHPGDRKLIAPMRVPRIEIGSDACQVKALSPYAWATPARDKQVRKGAYHQLANAHR